MIDLETWDTSPTAVVTAIGAVVFDPYSNRIGDTFYRVTNDWVEQQKKGRTINGDTVAWWLQQSHEAQQALVNPPARSSCSTFSALREFTEFLGTLTGDVEIWGNGADFDNVILGSLFQTYGAARPWSYSKNRCYRTIKATTKIPHGTVLPMRAGTHHNALDDALTQAQTLQAIYRAARQEAVA
jgi:exodeoxyribonuclease VIII